MRIPTMLVFVLLHVVKGEFLEDQCLYRRTAEPLTCPRPGAPFSELQVLPIKSKKDIAPDNCVVGEYFDVNLTLGVKVASMGWVYNLVSVFSVRGEGSAQLAPTCQYTSGDFTFMQNFDGDACGDAGSNDRIDFKIRLKGVLCKSSALDPKLISVPLCFYWSYAPGNCLAGVRSTWQPGVLGCVCDDTFLLPVHPGGKKKADKKADNADASTALSIAVTPEPQNPTMPCANQLFPLKPSCTSNDLYISAIRELVSPQTCVTGTLVDIIVTLDLRSKIARGYYDLVFAFGLSGDGTAETASQCTYQAGPIPPFRDLDGNICGDMGQDDVATFTVLLPTVRCVANADNQVSVPMCVFWNFIRGTCDEGLAGLSQPGSMCACNHTLSLPVKVVTSLPAPIVIPAKAPSGKAAVRLPTAKTVTIVIPNSQIPSIKVAGKAPVVPLALATKQPTQAPTTEPTKHPTPRPSKLPTRKPSRHPTPSPSFSPTTLSPTSSPTLSPTSSPTPRPTHSSTLSPTLSPTLEPTRRPTFEPTPSPTLHLTGSPTFGPSYSPTPDPTEPTRRPTRPTRRPSRPTRNFSLRPTFQPSSSPTPSPTSTPTLRRTFLPTQTPTTSTPSRQAKAKAVRTARPTHQPVTPMPSIYPTQVPSNAPTQLPTQPLLRSRRPTDAPSTATPTLKPTTLEPTTTQPTKRPSLAPTTLEPTTKPTQFPTKRPSSPPTTLEPTTKPTQFPTPHPTFAPTRPSIKPSVVRPTRRPTTLRPTLTPTTNQPTPQPTTRHPTPVPTTNLPTRHLTTSRPSHSPTLDYALTQSPTSNSLNSTLKPSDSLNSTLKPSNSLNSTLKPSNSLNSTLKPSNSPSTNSITGSSVGPSLSPSNSPTTTTVLILPRSIPTRIGQFRRPTHQPSVLPTNQPSQPISVTTSSRNLNGNESFQTVGVSLSGLPVTSTWESRESEAWPALKQDLAWALEVAEGNIWNVTMLGGSTMTQRRLLQSSLSFVAVVLTGLSQDALAKRLAHKPLNVLSSIFETPLSARSVPLSAMRDVRVSVPCVLACNVSVGDAVVSISGASNNTQVDVAVSSQDHWTELTGLSAGLLMSSVVRVVVEPSGALVRVRLTKHVPASITVCSGEQPILAVLECTSFNDSVSTFVPGGCTGKQIEQMMECTCQNSTSDFALKYPAHTTVIPTPPASVSDSDPATIYLLVLLCFFVCLFAVACRIDLRDPGIEVKVHVRDYILSSFNHYSWIAIFSKQTGVKAVDHVFCVLTVTLFDMLLLALFFTNRTHSLLSNLVEGHSLTGAFVSIVVGCLAIQLGLHELLLFGFGKVAANKHVTSDNSSWGWQFRYVLQLLCLVAWILMSWQILILGTSFNYHPVFACSTLLQRGWGSAWAMLAFISQLLSAPLAPLPFCIICVKALFDWLRADAPIPSNKLTLPVEDVEVPRDSVPSDTAPDTTDDQDAVPKAESRTCVTMGQEKESKTRTISSYVTSRDTTVFQNEEEDVNYSHRFSHPQTASVTQILHPRHEQSLGQDTDIEKESEIDETGSEASSQSQRTQEESREEGSLDHDDDNEEDFFEGDEESSASIHSRRNVYKPRFEGDSEGETESMTEGEEGDEGE